ncbi:MAG: sugar transferase [Anaerococcus sp.]|jgi:O-antigen biosynthesis protein WbqP|nr:sugar transferase [Peptoniphilaceae bacterium]MDY3055240.1 sugar transferase [Anaerococcus sp.]
MYQKYVKNAADRILALFAIIVLSPLLLIVALIIKISEPKSKVLFIQKRSGQDRKAFNCYKFRSMSEEAPKNAATWELDNAEDYISPLGAFLRKTSIDELPQLFNILKGEMSFIGPRPVILNETELLDLREKLGATKVRPGITGLAQISGRDNVSVEKKAEADAEYANNVNFKTDFKLMLMTIPKVLSGEGISEGRNDFKNEKK